MEEQKKGTNRETIQLRSRAKHSATEESHLAEKKACSECGGKGIIEHPWMPGYYGDCYTCGAD